MKGILEKLNTSRTDFDNKKLREMSLVKTFSAYKTSFLASILLFETKSFALITTLLY